MLSEHVDEWTQKWKREGVREGERAGKRDALKRLLRVRFGDLPPWAQARIDAATLGQLDAWLDGLFQVATLDALLGGQPRQSLPAAG